MSDNEIDHFGRERERERERERAKKMVLEINRDDQIW